jgi:hypothetical protein
MSTYNSIAISLDASDHWKNPSHKYDLSGEPAASAPREIHVSGPPLDSLEEMRVSPVPESIKNERTALMGDDESKNNFNEKRPKPMLISSIIVSSLFFGFSIGFSLGYFTAENGYFKMNVINSGVDPNISSVDIEQNIADEGQKILRFMDEFLFHEKFLDTHESQDPMMQFPFQGSTTAKRQPVYLSRPEAYSLLLDISPSMSIISEYSKDFFLISSGMDAQINQAYCGAATAAAIINSLRFITKPGDGDDGVDLPIDSTYDPYPYATQVDIFDNCTKDTVIKNTGGGPGKDGILTPPFGLNMAQVAALLECHLHSTKNRNWTVTTQYVDATHQTVGKLRFDLKNALQDPFSRVLVNYDRSEVGQNGGGHWSPVGSYSERQDMFLLLDVAKYKYPPTWIPTERLFDGLATEDNCGDWNYPDGQDVLSREERFAHTPDGYAATLAKIGCNKKLRGYIVVSSS